MAMMLLMAALIVSARAASASLVLLILLEQPAAAQRTQREAQLAELWDATTAICWAEAEKLRLRSGMDIDKLKKSKQAEDKFMGDLAQNKDGVVNALKDYGRAVSDCMELPKGSEPEKFEPFFEFWQKLPGVTMTEADIMRNVSILRSALELSRQLNRRNPSSENMPKR
jgi:hypothetical protein